MKRKSFTVLSVAVLTLGALQFVQPTLSRVPSRHRDLLSDSQVDPKVRSILKRSCGDCHTDETRLPWYGRISPVSWFVARHITKGREKLNFSEWPRNSANERQDIADSIDKQEMPMRSYLWVHSDARLTGAERAIIDSWADSAR